MTRFLAILLGSAVVCSPADPLPQSTLPPRPAQSTLPGPCKCSPCHCGADCRCDGGLCACPGCGLQARAQLAAELGKPLVVWVGKTDAALQKRLADCVHATVPAWKGDATPGVIPCPLYEGWPCSFGVRLPAEATEQAIRRELNAPVLLANG